jgi:hypothetical protein
VAVKVLLSLALPLALAACTKQPSPAPESPAQIAFDRFFEAGCTAPDDAGASDFLTQVEGGAPGFLCILEGGTVAGCGINCSADQ